MYARECNFAPCLSIMIQISHEAQIVLHHFPRKLVLHEKLFPFSSVSLSSCFLSFLSCLCSFFFFALFLCFSSSFIRISIFLFLCFLYLCLFSIFLCFFLFLPLFVPLSLFLSFVFLYVYFFPCSLTFLTYMLLTIIKNPEQGWPSRYSD